MPTDIIAFSEPFSRFGEWFKEAGEAEPEFAEAMTVASVGEDGMPSTRTVLMKGWSETGFVFYTNLTSRKGRELLAHPKTALLFHWKSLRRQIRIEGSAELVSDGEADAYFASRPKGSQIGAWASDQSSPMEGRFEFEAAIAKRTAEFGMTDVPRPEFWSGFRVVPNRFEFWQDRKFRLHDRHQYDLIESGKAWSKTTLYP